MMSLSVLEPDKAQKGLVHLYTGDGKGKTTAAAGLALRFLGCGFPVLFCQFLKSRPTGEIDALKRAGAEIRRAKCGEKFVFQMDPEEFDQLRRDHQGMLEGLVALAREGRCGLLVLDEVVDAVNCGAVTLTSLLELLEGRAPHLEVVLTGRNPAPELVERADYFTHFQNRKHPYEKGVAARRGAEY